ncbi:MAG: RNA polymerase sigma factor [Lachnospiraceae bacterium]|nr:RNA polymerase sigma factor [Lachnospiraceae bacterium]
MKGLLNKANNNTRTGGEVLDSREYEHIVKKHIDTVYRIAISYTKTPADADDVVQQTFLKLLTKCPEFKDREHEKRWLIRVCVNECNSLFSSFWRRNVDSIDELSKEPEFVMEESNDLYYAIKELPAKCRIVIYLFYFEGYSTKEIAEIIHINEATVRTRLTRGRKLLRTLLKEAWENE